MLDQKEISRIQNQIKFNPFLSFLVREVHRFSKVFFQTILIPTMNSSLYLVIFGVSLGPSLDINLGVSYIEFLIPGLVMMACLSNSFQNGSSSILSLKFGGDIIDIKASPLTLQQTLWALAFGGVCRGVMVGFIVFLVGEVFLYFYLGQWLIPHSPFFLLLLLILAGLVFSKLGVAVALWARTFEHIGAVGGLIILPLTYLGGVFFSLDMLNGFWRTVSMFNPMLYFINGIRFSMLGLSDIPFHTSLIVGLLSLVVFHFLCLFSMKYGNYKRW